MFGSIYFFAESILATSSYSQNSSPKLILTSVSIVYEFSKHVLRRWIIMLLLSQNEVLIWCYVELQLFVMWLDLVTYLHHHGHEDKLPWYRGKVTLSFSFPGKCFVQLGLSTWRNLETIEVDKNFIYFNKFLFCLWGTCSMFGSTSFSSETIWTSRSYSPKLLPKVDFAFKINCWKDFQTCYWKFSKSSLPSELYLFIMLDRNGATLGVGLQLLIVTMDWLTTSTMTLEPMSSIISFLKSHTIT